VGTLVVPRGGSRYGGFLLRWSGGSLAVGVSASLQLASTAWLLREIMNPRLRSNCKYFAVESSSRRLLFRAVGEQA